MSDDRRLRVEELFDAALDRDPADREAWLREQCGGDEDLFDEVGDLLRSLEGASGFLSRSAIEESPGLIRAVDPFIGEMVGPYRVREHIGSGGMGSVYLAEREDDVFHRCVAIKLIHSGFGRGEVLERFRRERRLLANLDHPNIAKLIDGGTLADGSPYFIMEYIEGKPIDAYCDEHGLSVEQRIELFRTICDAVSHAHRNLIIHRDLKPANILVTHDGVVKLLDFGIAKVLDSEHAAYESTLTVERRLTPAYASPEQIRGEQVTTASDVYSLGVILYELLTGTRPYQLESGSWKELEQAICEATPTRPSSVVSKTITSCDGATTLTPQQVSERRGVDPARLRQQLSGDLEWIILMALRKEPDRRYATVEQLSEDLRRIGASLPVQARPDTFGYLASRFVQRNRAAVAWAAALGIGLIVATVVSVDLALRESAAREVAEQRRVESEQERSRAVEAERQAQRRAEELEQVTAYQSELFSMIRIGRMGDRIREGIIDSARIGATIRGFEPDRIEAELQSLQGTLDLVNMVNVARSGLDEAVFAGAPASITREFADQPLVQASLLRSVAEAMVAVGMLTQAVDPLVEARDLYAKHRGDIDLSTLETRSILGNVYNSIGAYTDAERQHRKALEGYERAEGEQSPRVISSLNSLGAVAQASRRPMDAMEHYERALLLADGSLGAAHPTTLAARNNLGFLLLDMARLEEAEVHFAESLEISEAILGAEHEDTYRRLHALGVLRSRQGRLDEAESMLVRVFEHHRSAFGDEHPDTISVMLEIARVLHDQRRYSEAEGYASSALVLGRRVREDHHQTLRALNVLGRIAMSQRDLPLAQRYVMEELETRARVFGPLHSSTVTTRANFAVLLHRMGESDRAESLLRQAHQHLVESSGPGHPATLAVLNNLSGVLRARGKLDEAAAGWQAVYDGYRADYGADHPQTLTTLRYLTSVLERQGRFDDAYPLLCELLDAEMRVSEGLPGRAHELAVHVARLAMEREDFERVLSISIALRDSGEPMRSDHAAAWRYFEGDALMGLSRFEEAGASYLEALEGARADRPPSRDSVVVSLNRLVELYERWYSETGDWVYAQKATEFREQLAAEAAK